VDAGPDAAVFFGFALRFGMTGSRGLDADFVGLSLPSLPTVVFNCPI
jgi:hypothetical protein